MLMYTENSSTYYRTVRLKACIECVMLGLHGTGRIPPCTKNRVNRYFSKVIVVARTDHKVQERGNSASCTYLTQVTCSYSFMLSWLAIKQLCDEESL